MDAASGAHRRAVFHHHHCPHHHHHCHHHHCHHHHFAPHCHHIRPNSAVALPHAVHPPKPTDPVPNHDAEVAFHDSASAPVDEVLTGQDLATEEPEVLEEDDDSDPIFVMTDEWKEFFAKSEARRRLEKQHARNKGKKKQSAR
uniref:Uncharacterized protein n=1 Tax=Kalanchoe fedtschenkoi TaxID=63787 RepID=A0A7N0U959_KALFE